MLVIKGKNIKCDLWLLSIENSIEEINNFKKNAINDLIYQKEFIFADETIIGDGSI
jgi:hypothetical protein